MTTVQHVTAIKASVDNLSDTVKKMDLRTTLLVERLVTVEQKQTHFEETFNRDMEFRERLVRVETALSTPGKEGFESVAEKIR